MLLVFKHSSSNKEVAIFSKHNRDFSPPLEGLPKNTCTLPKGAGTSNSELGEKEQGKKAANVIRDTRLDFCKHPDLSKTRWIDFKLSKLRSCADEPLPL